MLWNTERDVRYPDGTSYEKGIAKFQSLSSHTYDIGGTTSVVRRMTMSAQGTNRLDNDEVASASELNDVINSESPMRSPERTFLPVFVISFNRGEYLKSIRDSYIKQDLDLDFIIHDNGSTEPRTWEALSELSAAGNKVYHYGPISAPDELDMVDLSVQRYRAETGYHGPYAVTDCDVDLSDARADAFRIYLELLERFPDVECVGPMLRIADIPKSYPLFNRVMERHVAQFWHRQPEWVDISTGRIAYLRHEIDTTLAVHRAGSSFRRLKSGLRVYHPFEAKHLDWYMSPHEASQYRLSSSPLISHWDNEEELAKYRSQPDAVFTYTLVEGEVGSLRTVTRSTLDHPS